MKYGVVMHVSHLKVGDIVRAINGAPEKRSHPYLEYTLTDGVTKRRVTTYGFGSPTVGGVEDFRRGYDTMTVYKVTDDYVSFVRPYLHINADGTLGACGVEHVDNVSRTHGGHWYELLS